MAKEKLLGIHDEIVCRVIGSGETRAGARVMEVLVSLVNPGEPQGA